MTPRTLLSLGTALAVLITPMVVSGNPINGWAFNSNRVKETLDRGLVAQAVNGGGVYINWRLLDNDAPNIKFDIFRNSGSTPINGSTPISQTTDFFDPAGTPSSTYRIRTVGSTSFTPSVSVFQGGYRSINVGSSFEKVGLGDLNGDGKMDFVVRTPSGHIDPGSWKKSGHTLKLKAFDSSGAPMWTYDLGWNIEAGVWYSPFLVYDFNGDGKAEVAAKTGRTPQDDGAGYVDSRDSAGRVNSGDEFLSIINGMTGQVVQRQPWPNREGISSYNERSRNQIAVAYLDGKTPFIIAQRGTYSILKVSAFQYHSGVLSLARQWDSRQEPDYAVNGKYHKQGSHSIRVGDVDGDNREEIVLGACVLNDDLTGLWAMPTYYDHPDHTYLGDLDPTNPGMEIYMGMEDFGAANPGAVTLVDAKTGAILWQQEPKGAGTVSNHVHGAGLVSDIDAAHSGAEFWGGEEASTTRYYHNAEGEDISHGGLFFDENIHYRAVYWDADLQREVIIGGAIFAEKPTLPVSTPWKYSFSQNSTTWGSHWTGWKGHSSISIHTGGEGDYVEVLNETTANWTLRWNSTPVAVVPGATYHVMAACNARDATDFRMQVRIAGTTTDILVNAPVINGEGNANDVNYFATFTVPPGVTAVLPTFFGNYGRYQIKAVKLVRDDNPGRALSTVSGQARLWADVDGDWREEIITSFGTELRIYSTTIPAMDRRVTLLRDPVYRADVAHLAMGYDQVPTTSYWLAGQGQIPVEDDSTLAYWGFESGSFLEDASGGGKTLTAHGNPAPSIRTRPTSGAGSAFSNPIPQFDVLNESSANFGTARTGNFSVADSGWMDSISANGAFTLEAFANIASNPTENMYIVSQWVATTGGRNFIFGVDSSRKLMLNMSPNGSSTAAFTSNLTLNVGDDYYVAVVFNAADTSGGVTFYLKNLTTNTAIQSQSLGHTLTGVYNSPQRVVIGTYGANLAERRWKGLIDEVRISDSARGLGTLLITPTGAANTLAHWSFESGSFLADGSNNGRTLTPVGNPAPSNITLGSSGAGSKFNDPIPQSGAPNGHAANFGTARTGNFSVADSGWMDSISTNKAFTLEAFANIASNPTDNMYIVSQWVATTGGRNFIFGVDSSRKLMLNMSPNGSSSVSFTSNLTMNVGDDYYVAVVFDAANPSGGVTFYLKNLTANTAIQTQSIGHSLSGVYNSPQPVMIGTYGPSLADRRWKGLLDEIRISAAALNPAQLLISAP